MFDLTSFSLGEMTESSATLRKLGIGAASMEDAAKRVVRYLHTHLIVKETGEPAVVLARFFKTHPFSGLDPTLQRFAADILGRRPEPADMPCWTLLATAGGKPEWNDRT